MTSTDTNISDSRTKTEILGDLVGASGQITFTAGRRPINVEISGSTVNVEGVNKVFYGEKAAAQMIAALIRG